MFMHYIAKRWDGQVPRPRWQQSVPLEGRYVAG